MTVVPYTKYRKCPDCNGRGRDNDSNKCTTCNGSGIIRVH